MQDYTKLKFRARMTRGSNVRFGDCSRRTPGAVPAQRLARSDAASSFKRVILLAEPLSLLSVGVCEGVGGWVGGLVYYSIRGYKLEKT